MSKLSLLACSLGLLAAAAIAPADAQTINSKARQKTTWYNSPHEIQIIDERPVIKDFREAPSQGQQIQLPPGPQGGGGYGGGGGGALGGDGGGTLPGGGVPIGGPNQGFRQDSGPGASLPHADFGHAQTNIPARGMGPKGPLANGSSNNQLMGKIKPWAPGQGVNPNVAAPRAAARAVPAGPVTASYGGPGGGYGPSVGTGQSYGGGANTSVSAKLLRKVK